MSILRLIQVSAAAAQASIDAATVPNGDPDAAVMRASILEFLQAHATRVEASGHDLDLLEAYRAWLQTATAVYSQGDLPRIPDYMRRGGLLQAEMRLAEARDDGRLPVGLESNAA